MAVIAVTSSPRACPGEQATSRQETARPRRCRHRPVPTEGDAMVLLDDRDTRRARIDGAYAAIVNEIKVQTAASCWSKGALTAGDHGCAAGREGTSGSLFDGATKSIPGAWGAVHGG